MINFFGIGIEKKNCKENTYIIHMGLNQNLVSEDAKIVFSQKKND